MRLCPDRQAAALVDRNAQRRRQRRAVTKDQIDAALNGDSVVVRNVFRNDPPAVVQRPGIRADHGTDRYRRPVASRSVHVGYANAEAERFTPGAFRAAVHSLYAGVVSRVPIQRRERSGRRAAGAKAVHVIDEAAVGAVFHDPLVCQGVLLPGQRRLAVEVIADLQRRWRFTLQHGEAHALSAGITARTGKEIAVLARLLYRGSRRPFPGEFRIIVRILGQRTAADIGQHGRHGNHCGGIPVSLVHAADDGVGNIVIHRGQLRNQRSAGKNVVCSGSNVPSAEDEALVLHEGDLLRTLAEASGLNEIALVGPAQNDPANAAVIAVAGIRDARTDAIAVASAGGDDLTAGDPDRIDDACFTAVGRAAAADARAIAAAGRSDLAAGDRNAAEAGPVSRPVVIRSAADAGGMVPTDRGDLAAGDRDAAVNVAVKTAADAGRISAAGGLDFTAFDPDHTAMVDFVAADRRFLVVCGGNQLAFAADGQAPVNVVFHTDVDALGQCQRDARLEDQYGVAQDLDPVIVG